MQKPLSVTFVAALGTFPPVGGAFFDRTRQCSTGQGVTVMTLERKRALERIEQVSERIQRSRSWIWDAVRRGEFVAPIRLSTRCTRWDSSAVDQWIDQQLAERSK